MLSLKYVDLTVAESETRLEYPFYANQWDINGQALVNVHNNIALITYSSRGSRKPTTLTPGCRF